MPEIVFPEDEVSPSGYGKRCKGAKKDGTRCGKVALKGTDFCNYHTYGYLPPSGKGKLKHGLFSKVLEGKELEYYQEALHMNDAEKIKHLAAVMQSKIKSFFERNEHTSEKHLEAMNKTISLYKELIKQHAQMTKGEDVEEVDIAKLLAKVN